MKLSFFIITFLFVITFRFVSAQDDYQELIERNREIKASIASTYNNPSYLTNEEQEIIRESSSIKESFEMEGGSTYVIVVYGDSEVLDLDFEIEDENGRPYLHSHLNKINGEIKITVTPEESINYIINAKVDKYRGSNTPGGHFGLIVCSVRSIE